MCECLHQDSFECWALRNNVVTPRGEECLCGCHIFNDGNDYFYFPNAEKWMRAGGWRRWIVIQYVKIRMVFK